MEELTNIPWGLIAPLLILQLVLALVAIVDILRAHETRGPKWIWIIVSLLGSMIGPILYFIVGRKNQ
jgi:hypothetical protein